jgi:hypothetical protein
VHSVRSDVRKRKNQNKPENNGFDDSVKADVTGKINPFGGENMQEKLYYPIQAKMVYDDCDYYDCDYWADEISRREAAEYFENIEHSLLKENKLLDNSGLMEYFWCEDKNLETGIKAKVTSAMLSIEIVGDEIFGVTELELKESLSSAEMNELKEFICGQNSDGFGESFEQREIKTPDGDLYVSFWSSGDNYFIDTQEEFEKRMDLAMEQNMSDGPRLEM